MNYIIELNAVKSRSLLANKPSKTDRFPDLIKASMIFLCIILNTIFVFSQTASLNISLDVNIKVSKEPLSITLNWENPVNGNVNIFKVYRKGKTDNQWGNPLAILSSNARSFTDNSVKTGIEYEYYLESLSSSNSLLTQSYISAGIEVPINDQPGSMLVLVDSLFQKPLFNEIQTFKMDLISEGWNVVVHPISRTQSVSEIKAIIANAYQNNTDLKSVLLMGHIPVPYSGYTAFDGHTDHVGCWATDLFYADLDGVWTDSNMQVTSANRKENQNRIGDGKFDQTQLPSSAELSVGRVDFFDLPIFAESEIDLMKRYLAKNHAFRTGNFNIKSQAVIDDNFPNYTEALNGWGNFYSMFDKSNVKAADFFGNMITEGSLWSYGSGGGSYTSCAGVGFSKDFLLEGLKSVFLSNYGSYFGDFDTQNNFMRSSLAANGYSLVNFWGGESAWLLQPMALGETIGNCHLKTLNNSKLQYYNRNGNWICTNLFGDPSLRQFVVKKPKLLVIGGKTDSILLSWNPSNETSIVGYEIYRSKSLTDKFEKIQTMYVDTFFVDLKPLIGQNVYMIRAVKREINTAGSFYNYSPGIIDSVTIAADENVNMKFNPQIKVVLENNINGYFRENQPIEINSICSVKNSKINKVELYTNGILAQSLHSEPYIFHIDNSIIGENTILCKVYAENGKFTISDPLKYLVTSDLFEGQGVGLKGTYYNDIALSVPVFSRIDSTINFQWGKGSPHPSINIDAFSVRWSGEIEPMFSDEYTFVTRSDDGARVYINDSLVVGGWYNQGITSWTGKVKFTAGKRYKVFVDFYDYSGGASMDLYWWSKNQKAEIIKPMFLYPTSPTSLLKLSTPTSLNLYPNPANDYFFLDVPYPTCDIKLIETQTGKTVLQKNKINSFEKINLPTLTNGVYIASITNDLNSTSCKLLIFK